MSIEVRGEEEEKVKEGSDIDLYPVQCPSLERWSQSVTAAVAAAVVFFNRQARSGHSSVFTDIISRFQSAAFVFAPILIHCLLSIEFG